MSTTLFVGNLPFSVTEEALRTLFGSAGPIVSTRVVRDRETQRHRGFGFVEYETVSAAKAAIAEFAGRHIDGRELVVTEARPRGGVGHR
jgi:RNA recognition motif-containing protein